MSFVQDFKSEPPKVSLILVVIHFITFLLSMFWSDFYEIVLLFPKDISSPLKYYKLFTYNLFINGLISWLYYSVILLLSGFIIERIAPRKMVIAFVISTSVLGALVYSIINFNAPDNRPLGSPIMIMCGFAACAIILILKQFSQSSTIEKVIAVLLFLFILTISTDEIGFLYGQFSSVCIGVLFGLLIKTKAILAKIHDV